MNCANLEGANLKGSNFEDPAGLKFQLCSVRNTKYFLQVAELIMKRRKEERILRKLKKIINKKTNK